MLLPFVFAALAYAPLAFGTLVGGDAALERTCGTFISKERLSAVEKEFQEFKATRPDARRLQDATVQVYFHVVSADETPEGGNIPDSQIHSQIDVINKAFSGSGLAFNLANVSRTVDELWFSAADPKSPTEYRMKNKLRIGDADALNIYTVGEINSGGQRRLGFATFPSDYRTQSVLDGVVILFSTLPGGTYSRFNLGQTATHEVGHWTGLYHTFEGGCTGDGDHVDDTPAESKPTQGCPIVAQSSCGFEPDPIHNYMDYSDDSCMNEFTPGQIARMRDQIDFYRRIPS